MKKIVNGKVVTLTEKEKNAIQNEAVSLQETEDYKCIRINELKQQLIETDYIVIKIAEGAATKEEYADIIAQRQQWRAEIGKLGG